MAVDYAEHIKRVVDAAPLLSDPQVTRLSVLLAPGVQASESCTPWPCRPDAVCAAHAPRISPADAAPLVAFFGGKVAGAETPLAPRTDPAPDPTWLYRYFDECGCLLYVGITGNPAVRDSGHGHSSPWRKRAVRRSAEKFATRSEAMAAERQAVNDERPVFNVALRRPVDTQQAMFEYMEKHA